MTAVRFDSNEVAPLATASPVPAGSLPRATGEAVTDLFVSIYESWVGRVRQWIRAMAADSCDADDLAQSVFLIVFRRLREFDGRNLGAWLRTITANQVRDHRRRAWARGRVDDSEAALAEIPALRPTPAEMVELGERLAALAQIVGRLERRSRSTFLLFARDRYTSKEIAAIQRAPLDTIRCRIRRSRATVVNQMAEWAEDPARQSPVGRAAGSR